jgi:RNA polymerase sigma-70 factor (ECF subfamily)
MSQAGVGSATGDGTWEAWMMAAQTGDARAYDRLLRAVMPLLRGIARRRIADPAEAEDAVQDTLLTLHQLRHSWDAARPLRPWLATLCQRRCIDRLRARARPLRQTVPIAEVAEAVAVVLPQAPAHLAAVELRAAIAALPRVQRTALTLAKLEELPIAEAAARSGLTAGSIKVATHRAIRTLRRVLEPQVA